MSLGVKCFSSAAPSEGKATVPEGVGRWADDELIVDGCVAAGQGSTSSWTRSTRRQELWWRRRREMIEEF